MTTFYLADDIEREPTIWAKDQPVLSDAGRFTQADVAVLRRCDLVPDKRRFWPELVERVTGEGLYAELQRVENAAASGHAHEWAPSYYQQPQGWESRRCTQCTLTQTYLTEYGFPS